MSSVRSHYYTLTYLRFHDSNHLTARLSQLVFNPHMYPNFYRFLELHERTGDLISNATTFSVSTDGGAFEWAGESVRNFLCKPSSVFDLGMWRMMFDIARFNVCAIRVLSENADPTIEEYVKREGYSAQFKDKFLIVCARTRPCLCGGFGSVVNCNCYSP